MKVEVNSKKPARYWIYFLNVIFIFVIFIPSRTSSVSKAQNLIYEYLGHSSDIRDDILIVIDDRRRQYEKSSIEENNSIEDAVTNIIEKKPEVVGVDIDVNSVSEIREIASNSQIPIVMKSSTQEGAKYLKVSDIESASEDKGNVLKVRVKDTKNGKYDRSLEYIMFREIMEKEYGKKSSNVPDNIVIKYTENNIELVSLSDIIENKIPKSHIQGKYVIIGGESTNNPDSVGRSSNVKLKANVLSSLLDGSYYRILNRSFVLMVTILLCLVMTWVLYHIQINHLGFISSFLLSLLLATFLLLQLGILWPIVETFTIILLNYIYYYCGKKFFEYKDQNHKYNSFIQFLLKDKFLKKEGHIVKKSGVFEKRVMTVMFSDIRGFTTISEKLMPDQLTSLLNKYFAYMSNIIAEYNGRIDKYLGDGIMSYWNAPSYNINHQENAVKCAIAMQKGVKRFNKMHLKGLGVKFRIGIGINTGEMRVGAVGGSEKTEYTVLGDNVNLCSRIESLTKQYGLSILVSEYVYGEQLRKEDNIIFRTIDEVIVKGKTQPIRILEPMEYSVDNLKIKTYYEKAFELYQVGRFENAREIFEALYFDMPSKLLIERIDELDRKKMNEWNGVWAWISK